MKSNEVPITMFSNELTKQMWQIVESPIRIPKMQVPIATIILA
jgi:hypothetical protein